MLSFIKYWFRNFCIENSSCNQNNMKAICWLWGRSEKTVCMLCISLEKITSVSFCTSQQSAGLASSHSLHQVPSLYPQISLFFFFFFALFSIKMVFQAVCHYWIVAWLKGERFYIISFILLITFELGLELLLVYSPAFSLHEQLFWEHNIHFLVLKFSLFTSS